MSSQQSRQQGWVQEPRDALPLCLSSWLPDRGSVEGTLITSFPALRGAQSHSLPSGSTEARVRQTVLGMFSPSALGLVQSVSREAERKESLSLGRGRGSCAPFLPTCELRTWGPAARWAGSGAGVMVQTRLSAFPLAARLAQQLPPDLQGRDREGAANAGPPGSPRVAHQRDAAHLQTALIPPWFL